VQLEELKAVLLRNRPKIVAAPPPVEPSHLNSTVIAGLRELSLPGESSVLMEITDLFEQSAGSSLTKLRDYCVERNEALAAPVAHALKGSSGNVGADHMAALCLQLEKEFVQVRIELKQLRAG
jgi:HPt (histidine-containing phosphotransfer) domain-containing protein